MNTYREAVRARVLYAMFVGANFLVAGSVIIASMSLHQEVRVIADIGSGLISLCAIIVAIVLGATSLYREVELKTVFPILTRELRRHEYIVGKYLGTLTTLAVFVFIAGGEELTLLALYGGRSVGEVARATGLCLAVLVVALVVARRARAFVAIPWSAAYFAVMAIMASPVADDRRMLVASCVLAIAEVAIVAAVATLFSSFSSPYFTALFTLGIWAAGRSADSLASLPERMLGPEIVKAGSIAAKLLPNLHAFVPPRTLLLGHVAQSPVWTHVGYASATAGFYVLLLVTASAFFFQRRDFQ